MKPERALGGACLSLEFGSICLGTWRLTGEDLLRVEFGHRETLILRDEPG